MGILKDLLKTVKDQLLPEKEEELPRTGKLVLSQKVPAKMAQWGISEAGLRLTYEYGEKTRAKMNGKALPGVWQISRTYEKYSENMWVTIEWKPKKGTAEVEKVALVIACWKGKVRL